MLMYFYLQNAVQLLKYLYFFYNAKEISQINSSFFMLFLYNDLTSLCLFDNVTHVSKSIYIKYMLILCFKIIKLLLHLKAFYYYSRGIFNMLLIGIHKIWIKIFCFIKKKRKQFSIFYFVSIKISNLITLK